MKPSVIFSFLIALFFTIFFSSFFPGYKPVFFAPFLAISFFSLSFTSTLWLACFSGIAVDLFASTHFGIHALISTICVLIYYRQKTFFKETPINIAIFSALISAGYILLNFLFIFIFDKGLKISLLWFFTDVVLSSVFDGIYALIFFSTPLYIVAWLKKRYALLKHED